MGVAELVPGVSGGTIAFISGIYEELITAINNINIGLFKTLQKEGFKTFWAKLNGNFLSVLFIGMLISIFLFSKLISWLMENKHIPLWSFFFGLVVASVIFVGKSIEKWNAKTIITLLLGASIAFYITTIPPSENTNSLYFLFFSGALAICAMILPGISGSYILVLLGSYKIILESIHERNFKIITTVALGIIFGILSFSKLLKWMFTHYKNTTLALLTGFILGSLNKIWPWKKVLETKTFEDKTVVINEQSISPFAFKSDPQLILAITLAVIGFFLIFILGRATSKK